MMFFFILVKEKMQGDYFAGSSMGPDCLICRTTKRIICVAFLISSVESCRIWLIQGCIFAEALRKIGICQEETAKGDKVGITSCQHPLCPVPIISAVGNVGPFKYSSQFLGNGIQRTIENSWIGKIDLNNVQICKGEAIESFSNVAEK